jgi:hypothetical protein
MIKVTFLLAFVVQLSLQGQGYSIVKAPGEMRDATS